MNIAISHPRYHIIAGFTMLEILIAMGIFAVGFAAVAAIFPTAVLLQKQTVDDVISQQVASNAQALLQARGLSLTSLDSPPPKDDALDDDPDPIPTEWMTNHKVYPLPYTLLSGSAHKDKWLPGDRSYPSTHILETRKVFWIPLVRDVDDTPDVVDIGQALVYVFILQREPHVTYLKPADFPAGSDLRNESNWACYKDAAVHNIPGVVKVDVDVNISEKRFTFRNASNRYSGEYLVKAGDQILDSYGQIYTVREVNNNSVVVSGMIIPNVWDGKYADAIWFAVPDIHSRMRPTKHILTLTNAVKP